MDLWEKYWSKVLDYDSDFIDRYYEDCLNDEYYFKGDIKKIAEHFKEIEEALKGVEEV